MTRGRPETTSEQVKSCRRITRRVSSFALTLAGSEEDVQPNKSKKAAGAHLARQVSNDGLVSISDSENDKEDYSSSSSSSSLSGRSSPIRCVSEFDKAVEACSTLHHNHDVDTLKRHGCTASPAPNQSCISHSLRDPKFLAVHTRALRLEAELQPMRLILSRLMFHPTLNRKGIFNTAVDPVALNLIDYFDVIDKPMDLGTIKMKLHAIVYLSRRAVVDDIRLVFANAMKYNPPHNAVHVAARDLLAFFEDHLQAFCPELAVNPTAALVDQQPVIESLASLPSSTGLQTSNPTPPTSSSVHTTVSSDSSTTATSITTTITSVIAVPAGTQATRQSSTGELLEPIQLSRRRKKRGSKVNHGHACQRCHGRVCRICQQGCLPLEPSLLICNGPSCSGTRIRKGATYFVSPDGGRHYCQKCHIALPAVLPTNGHDDTVRYKRDLLKRKNDEEIVEPWLSCSQCDGAVHHVCALYDEYHQTSKKSEDEYRCPDCVMETYSSTDSSQFMPSDRFDATHPSSDALYTFVSGSELPIPLSDVSGATASATPFSAEKLPETEVSAFIERRIRGRMTSDAHPNAERTVVVRIISDCHRSFKVPDVVRNHFRMMTQAQESIAPPSTVNYRSKAISLFQKIDGLDVCIFCMYVHEYDGDDHFDDSNRSESQDGAPSLVVLAQKKRVYIAYIDSVEHFRPRSCRTSVYHEMLVAYLATARKRGYETAHIWSCPPSRGNCFVFWNHPHSQRTPNPERLEAWYHAALSRAVDCGVVTDVQSLYDTDFKHQLEDPESNSQRSGLLRCPPLLDGDFWIEEAVRVHGINMTRQMKVNVEEAKIDDASQSCDATFAERCPARQVAALLRDVVLPHPPSAPFRKPVNAAAMKLTDYHKIITNPMDLGTVYSRCLLGEYRTLGDLVADVELVVSNAKTYNPVGHVVCMKADEVRELFFAELNGLVQSWTGITSSGSVTATWTSASDVSMSLDVVFENLTEAMNVDDDNSQPRPSSMRLQFDESLLETATKKDAVRSSSNPTPIDLVGGGPEAVHQRMVGDDTWLLEKNPAPSKGAVSTKRGCGRRRKLEGDGDDEPPCKRRRQAWLGIEVGSAVRRMRTSFFTCSLVPSSQSADDKRANEAFAIYTRDFDSSLCDTEPLTSTIADVRHSLLELSQFRNLEFNTLRHAKYSTAVLLYHFHNDGAAGAVPICTACNREIQLVRWHKQMKVVDLRHRKGLSQPQEASKAEELCGDCFSSVPSISQQFIPLQVTLFGDSTNTLCDSTA